MNNLKIKSDILIIGTGIAGLSLALKLSEDKNLSINIITKKNTADSNTNYAQGGIASVFNKLDSFDNHIQDTLESGCGLSKKDVVELVVKEGPQSILDLSDLGVSFDKNQDGEELSLGREGGHSHNRIVHCHDLTGREIEKILVEKIKKKKNIKIFEKHMAIDLIVSDKNSKDKNTVYGAYVFNRKSRQVKSFISRITILATGGCGKVYLYTSNPDIATGDGIAMAYRAGAILANLEFVQFHPTCLYHPDAKNFLISEAVRGEGGRIVNKKEERFLSNSNPQGELACRDKVAKIIDEELKKSGEDFVYLDISHKDSSFIKKRFPHLYENCLKFGIDMTKEGIPVVPAAHYMCGGVVSDLYGRSNIKNLFVIGEVACTGLHGANRLASNSLLEALVFAKKAYSKIRDTIDSSYNTQSHIADPPSWDELDTTNNQELITISHSWDEIRRCMWNYVGIVRSDSRLQKAEKRIKLIKEDILEYYWNFKITPDLIELRNIVLLAELIIKCANQRKESRGLHYNIMYPQRLSDFEKDTIIHRNQKLV